MKRKTPHVTVKIPQDLIDEMDNLIGKHGFRSRGEIAKEAIRQLMFTYKKQVPLLPPFEHFNLNEHGVRIVDRNLNRIVDISIKPKGIWCQYCEATDCRHIEFALSTTEIQSVIRKKRQDGWDLPEV